MSTPPLLSLPPEATRPGAEECMALREGLAKALPEIAPRYFYDDTGSALFEQITHTEVYYPTRAEVAILERHAAEILDAVRPRHLAELGSGAGRKIRLVLDAWGRCGAAAESVTMLDINQSFLDASIRALSLDYPTLRFRGILGDFTRDLGRLGPGGGRLLLFFAGTLGNLYPAERTRFFQAVAASMAPGDALLLGVDLIKDRGRLEAAYNDPSGLTAEFNLNALAVLNQRFGADFDTSAFAHRAFYDAENTWIEMRVVTTRPVQVHIPVIDLRLSLAQGAEIRTEISCKFDRASLGAAAAEGGLSVSSWTTDPDGLFALALLRSAA